MSRLLTRIKKLEGTRKVERPFDEHDAETSRRLDAWEAAGCTGPLPPAGPCPRKYTPEQWHGVHRFLCGLILRSRGLPLTDEFNEEDRAEIESAVEFYNAVDSDGSLSFPEQDSLDPSGVPAPAIALPARNHSRFDFKV